MDRAAEILQSLDTQYQESLRVASEANSQYITKNGLRTPSHELLADAQPYTEQDLLASRKAFADKMAAILGTGLHSVIDNLQLSTDQNSESTTELRAAVEKHQATIHILHRELRRVSEVQHSLNDNANNSRATITKQQETISSLARDVEKLKQIQSQITKISESVFNLQQMVGAQHSGLKEQKVALDEVIAMIRRQGQ